MGFIARPSSEIQCRRTGPWTERRLYTALLDERLATTISVMDPATVTITAVRADSRNVPPIKGASQDRLAKSRLVRLYSIMFSGRWLGAILANLLILQLTIVAGGFVCPMAGSPMTRDGTATMGGMPMPGTPGVTHGTPTQRGTPHPSEEPCKLPWAPVGCSAMTPCMPAFVVPVMPVLVPPNEPLVSTPALIMLRPASITRRPELPPPRA